MEKKKKSIVIGITSLLLVTLILLGLTYAYYKTRIDGNNNEKSVSVVSKNLSVTYQNESAVINAEGIEPGYTATKTFEVKNIGSETVEYSVILDNIENTFTRDQDWEYTLTKGGSEVATGTIAVGTHQVLIGSETLESGSTTYKLEVIYVNSDEDQSEDMGESLSFRVNISDETQTWDTASEGTLLYAIKNNDVLTTSGVVGSGETIPGQQASLETEARILSTQDDYGTSYVYRGNVGNNYVTYSNMCWRIVRVQGDGTIKLTLADENGECNADTYSTENTTSAFINNGTSYPYKSDPSFNLTDFSFENSDIPSILSNWSTSKNLDTSRLVDAGWCNDTAVTLDDSYGYADGWSIVYDKNLATNGWYTDHYYGAYYRLDKVSTANPTLKCNTKGIEGTTGIEANAHKYKNMLGILSADEVAFAGATNYKSGDIYNNYLQTNAYDNWYWTMSPYHLYNEGRLSNVWFVSSGALDGNASAEGGGAVRPAVVLNSNVEILSGNGTNANPYVIS